MFSKFQPLALGLALLPAFTFDRLGRLASGLPRRGIIRPEPVQEPADGGALEALTDKPGEPVLSAPDAPDTDPDTWTPDVLPALIATGYPPGLDRSRHPRAPETAEVSAKRFAAFLIATSDAAAIEAMKSQQLVTLYKQFCWLDHREGVSSNFLLGKLKHVPGVTKVEHVSRAPGRYRTSYTWQFSPLAAEVKRAAPKAVKAVGRKLKPKAPKAEAKSQPSVRRTGAPVVLRIVA